MKVFSFVVQVLLLLCSSITTNGGISSTENPPNLTTESFLLSIEGIRASIAFVMESSSILKNETLVSEEERAVKSQLETIFINANRTPEEDMSYISGEVDDFLMTLDTVIQENPTLAETLEMPVDMLGELLNLSEPVNGTVSGLGENVYQQIDDIIPELKTTVVVLDTADLLLSSSDLGVASFSSKIVLASMKIFKILHPLNTLSATAMENPVTQTADKSSSLEEIQDDISSVNGSLSSYKNDSVALEEIAVLNQIETILLNEQKPSGEDMAINATTYMLISELEKFVTLLEKAAQEVPSLGHGTALLKDNLIEVLELLRQSKGRVNKRISHTQICNTINKVRPVLRTVCTVLRIASRLFPCVTVPWIVCNVVQVVVNVYKHFHPLSTTTTVRVTTTQPATTPATATTTVRVTTTQPATTPATATTMVPAANTQPATIVPAAASGHSPSSYRTPTTVCYPVASRPDDGSDNSPPTRGGCCYGGKKYNSGGSETIFGVLRTCQDGDWTPEESPVKDEMKKDYDKLILRLWDQLTDATEERGKTIEIIIIYYEDWAKYQTSGGAVPALPTYDMLPDLKSDLQYLIDERNAELQTAPEEGKPVIRNVLNGYDERMRKYRDLERMNADSQQN